MDLTNYFYNLVQDIVRSVTNETYTLVDTIIYRKDIRNILVDSRHTVNVFMAYKLCPQIAPDVIIIFFFFFYSLFYIDIQCSSGNLQ